MSKHRKTWSQQDRLKILELAEQRGVAFASVEYGVSSSIVYRWQKQLPGEELAESTNLDLKRILREKEREINNLKQIIADQALAIKIKDDLFKKKILKGMS